MSASQTIGRILQHEKSVEALKLLNNAIVTSRIYPPDAPQVANAVERGYKGLKLFLRERGPLLFSLQNDSPCLSGKPLEQETLDSFPNLVVFRQLRMLGLSQLLLGAEMDRFAFGQILHVFNAPIEKAKKAGGGMAFITSLGLASYFPDEQERPLEEQGGSEPVKSRSHKLVKVRPELLACLCGVAQSPTIQVDLRKRLAATDSAVELLAAGVGHILQDILKKGEIVASPLFPTMLKGAEAKIEEKEHGQVLHGLSRLLVESLREPVLCVLLSQDYPEGFGGKFYDGLLGFLTHENLTAIFVLFREQLARARLAAGDKSPQVEFLGKAMLRLMTSGKGKHYLGQEKAKALIHEGEAARKKQRIDTGIQGLLKGNLNMLKNDELVLYLPEAIAEMLRAKAESGAETLIREISSYLREKGKTVGDTLLSAILSIGNNLVADGRLAFIDIFLKQLMEIAREAAIEEALLTKVVAFLHQVMQASWNLGDNRRGDDILSFFYMIRSGQIGRSRVLQEAIAKIQDRGIQRAKLPALLAECLASPLDEALGYRLVLQGPVAVRFLVESLINTEDTADRIKIIDLLTSNNSFTTSIIQERLSEHMPWYGKRNLLKLLGEAGREEDAQSVLPYLNHEDFRVQREAFLCLYKIGGKSRKKLLLDALADSSELIKVQLIDGLGSVCDNEVAGRLIDELLAAGETFSDKNRTDIVLQLLETLGRSANVEALKGIELFLQTRAQRSMKNIPDHVWSSAEKARGNLEHDLREARKKHQQVGQLRKNALKQVAKLSKTTKDQRIITGLPQEQTVRAFLARGDSPAALDLLVQMIEKAARIRNFSQAEKLREWLVEIDSTAFGHIIQAAEILDREKIAAIDKSHLEIWSRLYERLSTEEFAAVYHAQKHKKYLDGEVIVSQGALQTSLFFINTGKVKLYFGDKDKEVLVKTLGSGEIFGAGAFFHASVWTISVASVGPSGISSMKIDRLQAWSESYPGLEGKLQDFCSKFENIEECLKKSAQDRRLQKRHTIVGRVQTALLDNSGLSIGAHAMVELSDISVGGISYQVRISKKENARLLLGRKVEMKLPIGEKTGAFALVAGDILAVRSTYAVESDYSVHVKFDVALSNRQLQEIIKAVHRDTPVR